MQRVKQLFDDDSGVSPVIGVILMVAITVILAAVIASFVLGLGDSADDVQPNVQISDSQQNVSGEGNLDAEGEIILVELSVNSADSDADGDDFRIDANMTNDRWSDQADDIDAGDEFFFVVDPDDEINNEGEEGDVEDEIEEALGSDGDYIVVDDLSAGDEFDLVFDTEETSNVFDTFEVQDI